MKALNYLNYFFVGMPLLFCCIAIFDFGFLFYALLFSILTGAFQLITGLILFFVNLKDNRLQIYLIIVGLYFILWRVSDQWNYEGVSIYVLFAIPILLAFYFSIILDKKLKESTPKNN
jgi:hypothetical protein